MVVGEKASNPFVAGFFHDGRIEPIHHVQARTTRLLDEPAEIRIHLRRATGDIERAHAMAPCDVERELHGCAIHQFGTLRSSRNMAMDATEIAQVAEIELQGIQTLARNARKIAWTQQWPGVTHRFAPRWVEMAQRSPLEDD